MTNAFDAIVVGARCAGSPVGDAAGPAGIPGAGGRPRLVPERHRIDPLPASARCRRSLARWGLLGPAHRHRMPADPHLRLRLRPVHTVRCAWLATNARSRYCPRRHGPRQAAGGCGSGGRRGGPRGLHRRRGSDRRRTAWSVSKGDRSTANPSPSAPAIVVGADGRSSLVAEAVRPEQYNEKPPLLAGYYSYWSGLPMDGPPRELHPRQAGICRGSTTHDGLTLVIAGWPYAEFAENRKDIEGHYLKAIELAPAFAERLRRATRQARFAGAAVPNYFRKPYGRGWALVGDAGLQQGLHHRAGDPGCVP